MTLNALRVLVQGRGIQAAELPHHSTYVIQLHLTQWLFNFLHVDLA